MALFAFVLFAAFLFENDYLVRFAVADDACGQSRSATDLCVFAVANNQCLDIDLAARFPADRGHPQCLAFRHRILFAACSYDCVTHLVVFSRTAQRENARKPKNLNYT